MKAARVYLHSTSVAKNKTLPSHAFGFVEAM